MHVNLVFMWQFVNERMHTITSMKLTITIVWRLIPEHSWSQLALVCSKLKASKFKLWILTVREFMGKSAFARFIISQLGVLRSCRLIFALQPSKASNSTHMRIVARCLLAIKRIGRTRNKTINAHSIGEQKRSLLRRRSAPALCDLV